MRGQVERTGALCLFVRDARRGLASLTNMVSSWLVEAGVEAEGCNNGGGCHGGVMEQQRWGRLQAVGTEPVGIEFLV